MGIEKELCVAVADSKHRWKVSTELLWWVALVSLGGIKCNLECDRVRPAELKTYNTAGTWMVWHSSGPVLLT